MVKGVLGVLLLMLSVVPAAQAQEVFAACGVVDAIDLPIEGLVEGYDDFALYRQRFGGNHTGLDIGFDRWGDPVYAVARGQVTYSDPEGWDTEKGVVIVEHTFPDNSRAYSLYGHVEQTDTIFFPSVGACVERGQVIAAIGWPSRGRPHLHYEIRNFLPNDGGPGYVTGNPLVDGWYQPLDFTALWRARLTPAYLSYVTFDMVASVPPVQLDSGRYAIASGSTITGVNPPGQVLWRVQTDGVVTGLAALPGDRVVAHTRSGQTLTLENGRYIAVWSVNGPDVPFLLVDGALIFVTTGGGLAAYDTVGTPLWSLPGQNSDRIDYFGVNGGQIALAAQSAAGVSWQQVTAAGEIVYQTEFNGTPVVGKRQDGAWQVADGTMVYMLKDDVQTELTRLPQNPGRTARMTVDPLGNAYLYMGDLNNTLLSLSPQGVVRWRVDYPIDTDVLPPLLETDIGCLLYTLDRDGMLNVFSAATGELVNQLQLYAGGTQSSSPGARLLHLNGDENVQVATGFLTMLTLNSQLLGGESSQCLLG